MRPGVTSACPRGTQVACLGRTLLASESAISGWNASRLPREHIALNSNRAQFWSVRFPSGRLAASHVRMRNLVRFSTDCQPRRCLLMDCLLAHCTVGIYGLGALHNYRLRQLHRPSQLVLAALRDIPRQAHNSIFQHRPGQLIR